MQMSGITKVYLQYETSLNMTAKHALEPKYSMHKTLSLNTVCACILELCSQYAAKALNNDQ